MPNFSTTSGTKLLVVGTEFSVAKNADFNSAAPRTTTGYVAVRLDLTAVVAGDIVQIRIYHGIAGGTLTAEDVATASPGTIWRAQVGLLDGNWDITVKQTAGTGRTIGFSVVVDTNDVNSATAGAAAVTSIQTGLALAATAVSSADLTPTRAAKLDQLDAAVTTRAPAADTSELITLVDALPDAGLIAAAVWDAIAEGTEAFGDTVRLIAARLFGGGTVSDGDGHYTFKSRDGSKTRLDLQRSGTTVTVVTRDGT